MTTSKPTYTIAKSKPLKVNHRNEFFQNINRMRMLRQGIDTILVCDDLVEIPAHRFILTGWSKLFESTFEREEFIKNPSNRINIYQIDSDILEAITDSCYTLKLKVSIKNVKKLLLAAYELDFNHVIENCLQFIYTNYDVQNYVIFLDIAQCIKCSDLFHRCKRFLELNFWEFTQQESFLQLPKEKLLLMIQHCHLTLPSEKDFFHCLMNWINYDFDNRQIFCHELLQLINYNLIYWRFGVETILKNDVVIKSGCNILMQNGEYFEKTIQSNRFYMSYVAIIFKNSYRKTLIKCFDFLSDSWFSYGYLRNKRDRLSAITLDNKLYVLGGKIGHDCSVVTNTVDILDPYTNKWSIGKPMIFERFDFHVGIINNKIYVVGGKSSDTWDLPLVGEMFDPHYDRWVMVPELEYYNHTTRIAFINDKIYIFGHIHSKLPLICVIRIFDPLENHWSELLIPGDIAYRIIFTDLIVSRGNSVYLFDTRAMEEVLKYDVSNNSWSIFSMRVQNPKLSWPNGVIRFVVATDDYIYIRREEPKILETPQDYLNRSTVVAKLRLPTKLYTCS